MKKNKIIRIISLIILIIGILLIFLGIYKHVNRKNTQENKNITKTYLDSNNYEVINLYNTINQNDNSCVDFYYQFNNLKILSKDISNDLAFDMAVLNYKHNGSDENHIYYQTMLDLIKSLYGNQYEFNITKLKGSSYFDYYDEKANLIYIKNIDCDKRKIRTKIYSAAKYDDIFEIYEYRLYEEGSNYYKYPETDKILEIVLDENNKIQDTIENYSKGLNYKYTFKLKNNNYFLEEIELLY